VIGEREQEPVQAGVAQLRLRLQSRQPEGLHPGRRRGGDCFIQQRGLPDPGLAPQHHSAAVAVGDPGQQATERLTFRRPVDPRHRALFGQLQARHGQGRLSHSGRAGDQRPLPPGHGGRQVSQLFAPADQRPPVHARLTGLQVCRDAGVNVSDHGLHLAFETDARGWIRGADAAQSP